MAVIVGLALSAAAVVVVSAYPLIRGSPSAVAAAMLATVEFVNLVHAALCLVIATIALVALAIALRRRSGAVVPLALSLGVAVAGLAAIPATQYLSWLARRAIVRNIAEHAAPITRAVLHYSHEEGRPPDSLDDLVPHYLSRVPSTGVRGCHTFEYDVLAADEGGNRGEASWELRVLCPTGMLNWDIYLYRSSRPYPSRAHGGWVEPIGAGWAYVHE